jgi:hypothetical protein
VAISSQPGEVSRGKKMLLSGTDPESYVAEYNLVNEDKIFVPPPLGVGIAWNELARLDCK